MTDKESDRSDNFNGTWQIQCHDHTVSDLSENYVQHGFMRCVVLFMFVPPRLTTVGFHLFTFRVL